MGKYTGELWQNPCKRDCPKRHVGCASECEDCKEWREARRELREREYKTKMIGDIASSQKQKSWNNTQKAKISDRMGRRGGRNES